VGNQVELSPKLAMTEIAPEFAKIQRLVELANELYTYKAKKYAPT